MLKTLQIKLTTSQFLVDVIDQKLSLRYSNLSAPAFLYKQGELQSTKSGFHFRVFFILLATHRNLQQRKSVTLRGYTKHSKQFLQNKSFITFAACV